MHQDFINGVSLIISREERTQFLNLNSSEDRDKFISNFWKKRDPDPLTEVNEFKEEYFRRVAQANHLFGKQKGWLSDRGRVLVLLGPPETKRIFPTGYHQGDLPTEVWLYGVYGYPIVFIDRYRSGSYELSPISSRHLVTIQTAIQQLKPIVRQDAPKQFDFDVRFNKSKSDSKQLILTLLIPVKNILFEEKEGIFQANLAVKVEIKDKKGKKYPDVVKGIKITITQEQMQKQGSLMRKNIALQLGEGSFEFIITLASPKDNMKVTKKGKFKI